MTINLFFKKIEVIFVRITMSKFSWKLLNLLNHDNVYMSISSKSYIGVINSCSQNHEVMFIYIIVYSLKRNNNDVIRESMTSQQLIIDKLSMCVCVCVCCVCVCVCMVRGGGKVCVYCVCNFNINNRISIQEKTP